MMLTRRNIVCENDFVEMVLMLPITLMMLTRMLLMVLFRRRVMVESHDCWLRSDKTVSQPGSSMTGTLATITQWSRSPLYCL